MLKKFISLISVLAIMLSFSACKDNSAQTNNASKADSGTPVKTMEDIVGEWKMEVPWPADEAKEFGEELGIKNFTTTAKMTIYVRFNANGTATYINDFDLLMESAKKSCYTIFSEAFAKAKKSLDKNTFDKKVKETLGYQSYKMFLEKQIPDQYKDNPTYIEFFKQGYEEMLKYKDKAIEEQAAIGALWAEVLEDVGSKITFVDGKWQSNTETTVTWSYSNGALLLGDTTYGLEGNTEKFQLFSSDSNTVTCTKTK